MVEVMGELVIMVELPTPTTGPVEEAVVLFPMVLVAGNADTVVDVVNVTDVEDTLLGSVGLIVDVDVEDSVPFASPPVTPNNSVEGESTPATSTSYCPGLASASLLVRASLIAPILVESSFLATSLLVTVMLLGASPPMSME